MALRKGSKPVSLTHPHLMEEWSFIKNSTVRPEDFSYGSNKKVWWVCSKCSLEWETMIIQRTSLGRACPVCAGQAVTATNSLLSLYPGIAAEWDYEKNGDLRPENISRGSGKKIWWKCSKCGNSWSACVFNRVGHNTGCPFCCGRKVTDNNRLSLLYPNLAKEWDYKKNYPIKPKDVSFGVSKKFWWKCVVCGYSWKMSVCDRTSGLHVCGCPSCSGHALTDRNRFSIVCPQEVLEWDYEKNNLKPSEVSFGSNLVAWWKCAVCGHGWKTQVSSRSSGRGCPSCANKIVTDKNRFSILYPNEAQEWDYNKNIGILPSDFSYGSNKKVWWRCSKCGYVWKMSIASRTLGGGWCSNCSPPRASNIAQEWLKIYSGGIVKEYYIKELGIFTDGFDSKTNTVYEFLGNYWHGNPKMYSSEEVNPTVNKTYGQLYKETITRFNSILKAGYTIIYIWEKDFIANKMGIVLTKEDNFPISSCERNKHHV